MVLSATSSNYADETMPQTVPSAGFTPPFDYGNFADNFDLSLLPGGDTTLIAPSASPLDNFYAYTAQQCSGKPNSKIPTIFYQPDSPALSVEASDHDTPDFQTLLERPKASSSIYLEVPSNQNGYPSSPAGSSPYSPQSLLSPGEHHFSTFPSPNSPHSGDISLYSPSNAYANANYQYVKKEFYHSPNSPQSPNGYQSPYIKEESNYLLSPCAASNTNTASSSSSPSLLSTLSTNSEVLDLIGTAIIKQETTIDFDNILDTFNANESIRNLLMLDSKQHQQQQHQNQRLHHHSLNNKDHQQQDHRLLREVLRDTSFQKKYNIKPFDFDCLSHEAVKMEPEEEHQLPSDKIDPVLNLAFEQMKKDVSATCSVLGISPDPSQWSPANVLSWLQWTTNQFGLSAPVPEQWDLSGSSLIALSEEDFARRAPQSGSTLHAQLEIWKAACNQDDFASTSTKWTMIPPAESTSSNASSGGDISDEEDDDEMLMAASSDTGGGSKPTTSRGTGSSHIHLWQFLKELLGSPQTHGSCIRWIDRSKGVFKIEDSVKVARLWGKRKNRPAMNYDKLSRSIRQYYKKGIMKKTERSQRLVYQFCHPYSL